MTRAVAVAAALALAAPVLALASDAPVLPGAADVTWPAAAVAVAWVLSGALRAGVDIRVRMEHVGAVPTRSA